jgi:xanthine dehydrogenase small subunit
LIRFVLNKNEVSADLPAGTLLLDFIRYHQQLTGTKIGCREGDCGACTVLVGELKNGRVIYTSATSCLMAIGNAANKHIVTIEGINQEKGLTLVQEAFSNEGATQCGFCTPGFIVSLTGYCMSDKKASAENAVDAMNGNICRCTGYKSIERAAAAVVENLQKCNGEHPLEFAVNNKIIPPYFSDIEKKLTRLGQQESSQPGHVSKKILGGGTDLYVQQHDTMVHEKIDFVFHKQESGTITQRGNICEMGAAATVTDIAASAIFQQYFPGLSGYIKLVSSTQIRNMATIAGNFTNASPIGDFSIFFLALNARLLLTDGKRKREIALRDFYKGYKIIDKDPGEYIEKIWFELPSSNFHFNFEKVCKRTWLDIASVNTAIGLVAEDDIIRAASIAAGGVGPTPAYLVTSSQWLTGKEITKQTIEELTEIIQKEISPISDVRGTEVYKRLLLSQLIKAHFIKLFPALSDQIQAS